MELDKSLKKPLSTDFQVEKRTYSSFDAEEAPIYVKNIRLNPGITKQNFYSCVAHYLIMTFGFVMPGVLQPLIILDKSYYNVDQDSVGTITSLVLVIQLVVKIIVSIPYGHLSDKIGRKTMIFYGACSYLISCLLVPLQTSIFPGLVLAKVLLSNGSSALGSVPLIADYIHDDSKGKMSGISAMFLGVAAVFTAILFQIFLYAGITLGTCYVITGIFVFTALILNTMGLKGGYYSPRKPQPAQEKINTVSLKQNIKEAIKAFKSDGWLMISLVLNILGSSDFFIFFTFLTLYVKSLFPPETDDAISNRAVTRLQILVMIPAFFCNWFYGNFLDKPNKAFHVSLFALGGGILSFLLIASSSAPYDWKLIFASLVMGSTVPGLFVIGHYLGARNFPEDKRGIMIGFTGLVGQVGFFIISSAGGLLYDHWRKDGPFLICSGLLLLAIMLVLRIHKVMIENKQITGNLSL